MFDGKDGQFDLAIPALVGDAWGHHKHRDLADEKVQQGKREKKAGK